MPILPRRQVLRALVAAPAHALAAAALGAAAGCAGPGAARSSGPPGAAGSGDAAPVPGAAAPAAPIDPRFAALRARPTPPDLDPALVFRAAAARPARQP